MKQQQSRPSRWRRPLTSLLNEPPQVSETLPHVGGYDSLPANQPVEGAAMATAAVTAAAAAGGQVECGNAGEQQAPIAERGEGTAQDAAAISRAVVTKNARGSIVAALLGRVTAANACSLLFVDVTDDVGDLSGGGGGDGSGRPCCFVTPPGGTTACASQSATGETAVARAGQSGSGPSCGRHHRRAQEPGTTRFRDELLRDGRDGQLATPTWVENHVRCSLVWYHRQCFFSGGHC